MKNIKTYTDFSNESWNLFKKEKEQNNPVVKPGYISFLLPSDNIGYLKDDEIETNCGGKGKISEIFKGIGMDEDGHFIANCKFCNSNGILMDKHIKN